MSILTRVMMMMHTSVSVLRHFRDFHPDPDPNQLLLEAPRFAFV